MSWISRPPARPPIFARWSSNPLVASWPTVAIGPVYGNRRPILIGGLWPETSSARISSVNPNRATRKLRDMVVPLGSFLGPPTGTGRGPKNTQSPGEAAPDVALGGAMPGVYHASA